MSIEHSQGEQQTTKDQSPPPVEFKGPRQLWLEQNRDHRQTAASQRRRKGAERIKPNSIVAAREEMETILAAQQQLHPEFQNEDSINTHQLTQIAEQLAASHPEIGAVFNIGSVSQDVDLQIVLNSDRSPLAKLDYAAQLTPQLQSYNLVPDVFCTDYETFKTGNADSPANTRDQLSQFLTPQQLEQLVAKGIFQVIEHDSTTYYISTHQKLAFLYIAPQLEPLVSLPGFESLADHIHDIYGQVTLDRPSCLMWMLQNAINYLKEIDTLDQQSQNVHLTAQDQFTINIQKFNKLAKHYLRYRLGKYLFEHLDQHNGDQNDQVDIWKQEYWEYIQKQKERKAAPQPQSYDQRARHPDQHIADFLAKQDQPFMQRILLGRIFRDAMVKRVSFDTIARIIAPKEISQFSDLIRTFKQELQDSIGLMADEIIAKS